MLDPDAVRTIAPGFPDAKKRTTRGRPTARVGESIFAAPHDDLLILRGERETHAARLAAGPSPHAGSPPGPRRLDRGRARPGLATKSCPALLPTPLELAERSDAMSAITGVAAEARELAARADALRAQCEALAASTHDEAEPRDARPGRRPTGLIGRATAHRGTRDPHPIAAHLTRSQPRRILRTNSTCSLSTPRGCGCAPAAARRSRRPRRRFRISPARRSPTTLSVSKPADASWRL